MKTRTVKQTVRLGPGLLGLLLALPVQAADPVLVGSYNTGGLAPGVVVSGQYAYVADYWEGLHVFDVSKPTNCMRLGGYDSGGTANAYGVAVSGNYAYVADGVNGLQVIDVSNPTNCVRVGGFDTNEWADAVAVSGNYTYVADAGAGLQVIDVSDPTNSCA